MLSLAFDAIAFGSLAAADQVSQSMGSAAHAATALIGTGYVLLRTIQLLRKLRREKSDRPPVE
jgi:hypothetical protein